MAKSLDVIKAKILEYFQHKAELRLLMIFGSYVRGKALASSDLDLAIYLGHKLSADEMVTISTELSLILGLEIDLVDLANSHGPILEEVLVKGERLIEKSPEYFAQLLKRMWYEKEDDARFREKTMQIRMQKWKK